jgi:hypothetical protein
MRGANAWVLLTETYRVLTAMVQNQGASKQGTHMNDPNDWLHPRLAFNGNYT